ncbi:MAG TPA: MBL fold metallo-hydrolase [Candidatus Eisenbacteria bacterium]|uniref:MBL fold metallo-hydrolase n=1 Tax=Eiseniibacteriota bacterium TaxID=2212470 RepID=A0A7V2AUQ9_UNCEI|nr:MBL fold metallo-hydrolase [Candidatus Eisenbacteria bacterium]
MLLKHFFLPKIAHSSYILAGQKTCAVVDPQRDVEIYIEAAKELGMKITHILETHLHADFVSGHIDLAGRTGAVIYAPKKAQCSFDHVALREGDTFEIEDISIRVIETPGHTPEHISYIVTDRARGRSPIGVFCGDTLFVGDVGRPDLFPGKAKSLASKLYDSLHKKLLKLPDFCEIYPAHGAGSLCGRAMGAKWRSTIGYEKRYNAALNIRSRKRFIESLTTGMPPAPDHFSRCSAINAKGPTPLDKLPPTEELDAKSFSAAAQRGNSVVLDIYCYGGFGAQHVRSSYNIDLGGNFPTFAGWIMPPDKRILLVAGDGSQAEQAILWMRRVGLDKPVGLLKGGMPEWVKAGLPTGHVQQLSPYELHAFINGGEKLALLDVRAPSEYENHHIKGAVNIPVADLRTRHSELDPGMPTIVICSTGNRSSLGASILKRNGFKYLMNAAGGMSGYSAAGFAPECPICFIPHGSHFLGKKERRR